jgi:RNA polymerase sigma-70 factor (ECF subfamily)
VPASVTRFDLEAGLTTTGTDFHDFYRDHRPAIGRALAVTLGDTDLAADAVDEAMVRALQRWDRVSVLDNPAGWAYRVGLNYARSGLRRRLRRPRMRPDGVITGMGDDPMVDDPAIAAALASLSVEHRAVVVCRHLFGWSERETADALDLRPGTVKSRLSRALANLERSLADHRPDRHAEDTP